MFVNKENILIREKACSIHNHEPELTINHQATRNSIKQKMSEINLNEMSSKIFRKDFRSLGNDTQLSTRDILYIRRNVYNTKTKYNPTLNIINSL